MEFRINTYNEDYIMIRTYDIFKAHLEELKSKDNQENIFIRIHNSIFSYEYLSEKCVYPEIKEIAINKNSTIGTYILANQSKPENITIAQIIHALLICINRNDWQYYDAISNLIKIYGQTSTEEDKTTQTITYEELKSNVGEEIANYITNSKLYSTQPLESDKKVYLYEEREIKQIELPKLTLKTKKRTIN